MKQYWRRVFFFFLLFSFTFFTWTSEIVITAHNSQIYKHPSLTSASLTTVKKNIKLKVVQKKGSFYQVELPGSAGNTTIVGYIHQSQVQESSRTPRPAKVKKDKIFLMGLGMVRLNWADVEGNDIRFRYSDLGLPTDFSTRERASFMVDGTFGGGNYQINGHLNYDPENRITEPPLDFLLNVGNDRTYLSVGDYRQGVMLDSVFSRYYHPFRGGILGIRSERLGLEVVGGLGRGESGIEEIPADLGSGPYYIQDSPILRGSELVFLITKSATNPDMELLRTPLVRNQDYYIDYDRGAIIFTRSLYSFDELGNPVSILVSYQYEALAGRFSRAVFGVRGFVAPLKVAKLTISFIADADKDQSLADIFKYSQGIYSFGLNINAKILSFFGEYSFSAGSGKERPQAFFGGGILNIRKNIRFFFNGWGLDENFSTFANRQIQYGYSLFQIFPSYSQRNIFLSPFQFTRNLGAELYPFSLARLSIDETEYHGFLEWDNAKTRVSTGVGTRKDKTKGLTTDTLYLSAFHNEEKTNAWAKLGLDRNHGSGVEEFDARTYDLLAGIRRQVAKISKGSLFVQLDYQQDWFEDFLDLTPDTRHLTYSIFTEYLTGREGIFAGYRKEILTDRESEEETMKVDIYEIGIRRHIFKALFLDSRYRRESGTRDDSVIKNDIITLGGGYESQKFRAMARYEIQTNENESTGEKGKRRLLSLFLFGSPLKHMSLSLRYYKQLSKDPTVEILPVGERSEEQLNFRFLWRPKDFLNLYSQWRYDTNLELYPPLDRTKSNSLAGVQGLKIKFSPNWEFLANYKILKVWGPIENQRTSLAAELGYRLFRHLRIGAGVEKIDFTDRQNIDTDYHSTVGYLKLVAIF